MKNWILLLLVLTCGAYAGEGESGASEGQKAWKHESELAFALAAGNSSSTTANAKQSTSYFWSQNTIRLDGHYLYSLANGSEAAKNWSSALRYERTLNEKIALFVGTGWQGDRFAGFDYRSTADVGAKYNLIHSTQEKEYLIAEAGYRFQYEQGVGAGSFARRSHIVRVYFEGNKLLTPHVAANLYVEFLPDLANTSNLMINFQPSLTVTLNEIFSLKLSYKGRFDGAPAVASAKKFDSLFSTALVASY